MALPPFLAAIPVPVLIGLPILGLIVGACVWEYNKSQAAAATGPGQLPAGATGPTGPAAPAPAPAPPKYVMKLVAPPGGWKGAAPPPSPAAATTGFGPQILAAAQQALGSLGPAPSSSDFAGSIIYQVVTAALNQLAGNPTTAQLGTAMTDIQGTNGSNLQQSSQAQAAYNILNRVNQTVSA